MSFEDFSIEELEAEIARRKENQEKANGFRLLRTKDSFTEREKVNTFNIFHDFLFDEMKNAVETGNFSKDFDNYVYEKGLLSFLGHRAFDFVNEYYR